MSMTAFLIAWSVVMLAVSVMCGFKFTLLYWGMLDDINRTLSPPERVHIGFVYPGLVGHVAERHRALFPGTRKPERMRLFICVQMGAGVLGVLPWMIREVLGGP